MSIKSVKIDNNGMKFYFSDIHELIYIHTNMVERSLRVASKLELKSYFSRIRSFCVEPECVTR